MGKEKAHNYCKYKDMWSSMCLQTIFGQFLQYNFFIHRSVTKYSHAPLTVKRNVPEGKYLSLMELGEILRELSYHSPYERGTKPILKPTNDYEYVIERGQVNLIAVDTGTYKAFINISNVLAILASIFKSILFLYMNDPTQFLPTYEEVVICTEDTTVEEVK